MQTVVKRPREEDETTETPSEDPKRSKTIPGKGEMLHYGYIVKDTCTSEEMGLAIKNKHERCDYIIMDEGPHQYYVKGEIDFKSCTTVIHDQFFEFDSVGEARKMCNRQDFRANVKYEQYQAITTTPSGEPLSIEDSVTNVVQSWEENGKTQSGLGTVLHRKIEEYYNGVEMPISEDTVEFTHFRKYANMVATERVWKPFRTEMVIWEEESKICGSIDMLYVDKDCSDLDVTLWKEGKTRLKVYMVDWKRSKKINKHGFGKRGKGPCASFPDANYHHYRLQLNLYKYMLEKRYMIDVGFMSILVCHPNQDSYLEYVMDDLSAVIKDLVDYRITTLKK
jgi:hypothetical protein